MINLFPHFYMEKDGNMKMREKSEKKNFIYLLIFKLLLFVFVLTQCLVLILNRDIG